MRICFFGNFTAGGTESACFKVANELVTENEVFVLSTGRNKNTFFLNENIPYHYISSKSVFKKSLEVFRFLKINKIDLFIIVEALAGLTALLPAILTRCKLIVWEHANYYQNQGSKYINLFRNIELRIADAYVVLTKRDLNNFKKNFKIKTKIDYIYNIADEISECDYDINSKTIISAGYIRKIKNFIVIPEIAKIVFEKHPDWKWLIYGNASGAEYEKIKAKVIEYKLENNIIFPGRSLDMDNEYKKASFYVMTSLQEGLPMVLLEAKSHKLPLVSFDIETGPDEIISNDVNGYLVKAYDISEMADKINRLIENQALRKSFSDNALNDISNFDKQNIVNKWNRLINSLQH